MAKQRRYSIEIKDDKGNTVIFMAADWTVDDRRVAVAQVLRLTGVPDAGSFTDTASSSALRGMVDMGRKGPVERG
jgi:hypothetical protein